MRRFYFEIGFGTRSDSVSKEKSEKAAMVATILFVIIGAVFTLSAAVR